MYTFAKIALFCLLLIGCAIFARAQQSCPVPPPSPFKHDALIATVYDEASGQMKTTLKHPRLLSSNAGQAIYLYAAFTYSKSQWTAKPTVDVAFISVAQEYKYRDANNLVFMTDDAPLSGGSQYKSGKNEDGLIVEGSKITLSYADLARIISAKKVEARLGSTHFALTENHLESLRELASLMRYQTRR